MTGLQRWGSVCNPGLGNALGLIASTGLDPMPTSLKWITWQWNTEPLLALMKLIPVHWQAGFPNLPQGSQQHGLFSWRVAVPGTVWFGK